MSVVPFGSLGLSKAALNPAPAKDFSDLDLLHAISTTLIGEHDSHALYGRIVDAVITITGAQYGTMQLLCPPDDPSGQGGKLKLLCSRGFDAETVGFWEWVSPSALSSCTLALKLGERAIISDFEQWPAIAGSEDLQAFRRAGIRAAQTTPLRSRAGKLLGMISSHWSTPHQPSSRDLRMLDIVARQAADLLERTIAEESLREREEQLKRTCNVLLDIEQAQRETEAQLLRLNETLEQQVAERTAKLMLAEEQLRQSQKMEAVGQLTGGLAHDFNNLLAGISGALELVEKRIGQGRFNDLDKYIVAAQNSSRRAAALTHRLLAFSRRQTLEPQQVSVNALMHGMVELIQRTVGPAIEVKVQSEEALWPAFVDAGQLENALLNLCINARDAMPAGGAITLRTDNHRLDAEAARALQLAPGDYLSLSVADTGSGMPPEIIAHVFEPFFTTKPVGQGTGLGLSMIYGFAQQSGGHVRLWSHVGSGTQVWIYLPRDPVQRLTPAAIARPAEAHAARHTETVLLVDDEPTLRMLLTDVLSELGYTVLQASDGASGLRLLRSDMHFDLLITDVGLPGGMNGRQMADAGRELRPGLKTLFITGYAEAAAMGDGQLPSGMGVLTKPFAVERLEQQLRNLLGA